MSEEVNKRDSNHSINIQNKIRLLAHVKKTKYHDIVMQSWTHINISQVRSNEKNDMYMYV